MASQFFRLLRALSVEERMVNGGVLVAIIGLFLPWVSGDWLGGLTINYSGFGFFTSFVGIGIFICNLCVLLITCVPLLGGPPLMRKDRENIVRLCFAFQSMMLTLAALSVLTKVTFEFSRMEVRFGVYVTLVGTFVSALYAFISMQEHKRGETRALFYHSDAPDISARSMPPPPPSLHPE